PRVAARRFGAIAAASFALLTLVAGAAAASPSAPPPQTDLSHVQAWLDSRIELPPDAPAGGIFKTGFTFWDTTTRAFAPGDRVEAGLVPKQGSAKPGVATITPDRPGHVLADMVVPKGGAGQVQVFARSGGREVRVPLAGIGPPPDAPLETL